jgi:hypothetical protein
VVRSAGNWAGPGQSGPSPSCFVSNGFGQTKPKIFLGRVVPARSVKTVAQPGPKHVVPSLGRAGPSSARIFDYIKSKYYNHIKFISVGVSRQGGP